MLPSNNPIIANYTDQSLVYHKPFINNDPLFSTLCNFPSSPFFHFESENDEFLPQPYQDLPFLTTTDSTNNPITELEPNVINNNMVDSNKNFSTPPRKRTCKKDRHSKINTAQGPRDRRMRLSLEIAREFFGLQDILGYDKASRTVEWLLSKAKSDIKNLVANKSGGRLIHTVDSDSVVGTKSASSASECEVISGIDHGRVIHAEKPSKCVNKEKTNRLREVRKAPFRPARARESREKARARARERTNVKRSVKSKLFTEDATTNQDSNQVGSSWSPISFEVQLAEVEKPNSHEGQHIAAMADMVDDDHSLVIMDKFNYLQGSTGISQEPHQFEDFQFYGKLWESYNIQSLL